MDLKELRQRMQDMGKNEPMFRYLQMHKAVSQIAEHNEDSSSVLPEYNKAELALGLLVLDCVRIADERNIFLDGLLDDYLRCNEA